MALLHSWIYLLCKKPHFTLWQSNSKMLTHCFKSTFVIFVVGKIIMTVLLFVLLLIIYYFTCFSVLRCVKLMSFIIHWARGLYLIYILLLCPPEVNVNKVTNVFVGCKMEQWLELLPNSKKASDSRNLQGFILTFIISDLCRCYKVVFYFIIKLLDWKYFKIVNILIFLL